MSCRDTISLQNQIRKNNRLDLKKLIRINSLILEILTLCLYTTLSVPYVPYSFPKYRN